MFTIKRLFVLIVLFVFLVTVTYSFMFILFNDISYKLVETSKTKELVMLVLLMFLFVFTVSFVLLKIMDMIDSTDDFNFGKYKVIVKDENGKTIKGEFFVTAFSKANAVEKVAKKNTDFDKVIYIPERIKK